MGIKTSTSRDNSGEISAPQSGQAVVNSGSSSRDLLINYNAQIAYERNSAKGNPGFVIDTNFDIKNGNAVSYALAGVLKTMAANTSFDTGTAANIATSGKWGIAILTYDGTTPTVTWAQASAAMSYATEADAKAALGVLATLIPASGFAAMGYVTVQSDAAATWTAGTDALAGGTGGTPAQTTTYYNDPTLNGTFGGWQIGNLSGTVITQ